MDGCGFPVLVVIVILLVATSFSISARSQHKTRIQELRRRYALARSTGNPQEIVKKARAIITEYQTSNQPELPKAATEIYHDVLRLLHSSPALKPFALELGRLSYGSKRKDKSLTIYDEQAIMNDINANI